MVLDTQRELLDFEDETWLYEEFQMVSKVSLCKHSIH